MLAGSDSYEASNQVILIFSLAQELITNVQFANDEGDPGMGLELGINAFLMAPSEDQSKGKRVRRGTGAMCRFRILRL